MRRSPQRLMLRLLALLACAGTVGCATPPAPPAPRTTVILLPDADGRVGVVLVGTDAGSQRLEQAYSAATVDAGASTVPGVRDIGRERVKSIYAELLKAQPSPPATFVLTFLLDKAALTDQAKALLPELFAAVRTRKPSEITIFGHADASGTEERNFKLSAERARFVADLLRRQDPSLDRIGIHAFGDAMPLVPSETRAADPRNRRAEVVIF